MESRPRNICLVLAIGLGLSPISAGQETDKRSESHIWIPFDGRNLKALQQRFQSLHNADERNQMLKNALRAKEQLRKNPKDPLALDKLKELTESQSFKDLLQELKARKDELPPDKVQEFNNLQEFLSQNKPREPISDPPQGGRLERNSESLPRGPKAEEPAFSPRDFKGPPSGMPSTPSSERSTPEQSLRRWLVNNFNPNEGPLADSPAFQEAMRELRRVPPTAEAPGADDGTWAGRFARWSDSLAKSEIWSKVDLPSLNKWRLPSTRSMPKIQSPISAQSLGKMPNVTFPSGSALDRGLQILWVVLILVAGVLIWKLLGGNIPGVGRSAKRSWRLGPWPVAPGAVSSRKEVILAFEYLSLLRVGPEAKSRNHLELAAELGQSAKDHRQSADRLAAVYELARYAPADEPLTADALAAARTELCLLAGVNH